MNIFPVLIFISFFLGACASSNLNSPSLPASYDETAPAATVGPLTITQKDLSEAAAQELKPIENDIYSIKNRRLDQLIRAQLWRIAAEERGISVAELQQKVSGDPEAFLEKLKKEHNVRVFLKAPRFSIPLGDSPMRGKENAPITIVEYSDFECPFCKQFQPTLHKIQDQYKNQVKFSFKHIPLPFHTKARQAHMASLCAGAQGKFWEYRDKLFERDSGLERDDLIRYAGSLGLSTDAFTVCLDSKQYAEVIDRDLAEARELGVQGTPTFFVNGRLLSGAQPFSRFSQLIDEELKSKK